MEIQEILYKFAKENNIDDIGISKAENFEHMRDIYSKSMGKLKGFIKDDIEKRIYPSHTVENAKSIIAIAKSYNKRFDFSPKREMPCFISVGAVGEDYHKEMTYILEKLALELKKEFDFQYGVFSDTGPLSDRDIAKMCGIGGYGKNGSIVTKTGGSAVFIGYMITTIDFDKKAEKINPCTSCGKCITVCPTGALSENGFNMEKCISYLTQLKRPLTKEEMLSLNKSIYGCDRCQMVCPLNKESIIFKGETKEYMPEIEFILSLSKSEFKEIYGHTALFWRGSSVIKRNAIAAAASYGTEKAKEIITPFLKSESPLLKDAAQKAIDIIDENKR